MGNSHLASARCALAYNRAAQPRQPAPGQPPLPDYVYDIVTAGGGPFVVAADFTIIHL